jgi:2-hydroxy-6-oxonona-2,4-dienedioate hydrolase
MSLYDTWQSMRQFAVIGGEKLAYVRVGTSGKPPLILVHGWLSHARFWQTTMDALQADYDCIAVDLYGFGFSDRRKSADYSIETQARRIFALATSLGLKTFSLMGHSMGGGIVLAMAAEHPERIEKVIDVAGVVTGKLTPYVRRVLVPPVLIGYYAPPIWWISRIGMRHWRWYKYLYADNAVTYRKDVIPLGSEDLLMSVRPGCEASTYLALKAIDRIDLTARLQALSVPTLILFGVHDNTVPLSEGQHAHQHVPNSQMIIYDECGHEPMYEIPERFITDVRAFLQGSSNRA